MDTSPPGATTPTKPEDSRFHLSVDSKAGKATFAFNVGSGVMKSVVLNREKALSLATNLQSALALGEAAAAQGSEPAPDTAASRAELLELRKRLASIERRVAVTEDNQAGLATKMLELDSSLALSAGQLNAWKSRMEQIRQLLVALNLRTRQFP